MLNASHLLKAGRANQKLTDNAMSVIQQQSLHVSKLLDELFQVSPSPPKPKSHATPLKSVRHLRKTIKKVLVVEHQKDNREMLEALLKMEGFEVSTAQNANEALNLILHIMPDAALIDLGMGRDIGHRLAFNIRFQLAEKILLIAFTGRGESIETGAPSRPIFDEHLAKPIDLDQLLNILNPAPTSQSKPLSQVTSPISSQTR
jgi:CheY-like chemotaxis protein